jgi:hypothetical protein
MLILYYLDEDSAVLMLSSIGFAESRLPIIAPIIANPVIIVKMKMKRRRTQSAELRFVLFSISIFSITDLILFFPTHRPSLLLCSLSSFLLSSILSFTEMVTASGKISSETR